MKTRHAFPSTVSLQRLLLASGAAFGIFLGSAVKADEIRFGLAADTEYGRYAETWKNNPVVINHLRAAHAGNPLKGVVILGDLTAGFSAIDGDGCAPGTGYASIHAPWYHEGVFNSFLRDWAYPDIGTCPTAPDYEPVMNIGIPTYMGLGNHDFDYSDAATANLWRFIENRHHPQRGVVGIRAGNFDEASKAYSWDWYDAGGRRLHLINLQERAGVPLGTMSNHPSNTNWLDADLAALPAGTPVVLFQHVPFDVDGVAANLDPILRSRKPNILAAFNGDSHTWNGGDGFYTVAGLSNWHTGLLFPIWSIASVGATNNSGSQSWRNYALVSVDLEHETVIVDKAIELPMMNDWHVDAASAWGLLANGSMERPYRKLEDAVEHAQNGDFVWIAGGDYRLEEPARITNAVRIVNFRGPAALRPE